MGKVNMNDVENYKGGQGAGFFGLENDKDVATVRFCHENTDSIEIIACHQIEVDGKKRKVSCLRNYDDPVDKCPFCAAGNPVQLRFFLHLLEYEKNRDGFTGKYEKKVWERGRSFQKEILGLSARYNPLCDTAFEIERQGKKGDTQTKYGIYPMNYTLDELPISNDDLENDSVLGTIILEKSASDMEYYLDNNEFPPTGNSDADTAEIRSRSAEPRREEPQRRSEPTREVPTSTSGNRRRI